MYLVSSDSASLHDLCLHSLSLSANLSMVITIRLFPEALINIQSVVGTIHTLQYTSASKLLASPTSEGEW